MEGLFELAHEFCESFQGQQVGAAGFRMAAMAESIEQAVLFGAEPPGSSSEVRLLQRPSSHAPADLSPRDKPGRRVR